MRKANYNNQVDKIREKVQKEILHFWYGSTESKISNNRNIISFTLLDSVNPITEFTKTGIALENNETYYYDHLPIEDLILILDVFRSIN